MQVQCEKKSKHYCYILSLIGNDQVTYIGYTVNIVNRLRQHNGEIVGGARYTSSSRHGAGANQWRLVALVTAPDLDHRRGLSLEWHIKYPDGGRCRGRGRRRRADRELPSVRCAASRVCGMVRAMAHPKFANDDFSAWVVSDLRAVMDQAMIDASHVSDRCEVHVLNEDTSCPMECSS